jgi:hypothetical protein
MPALIREDEPRYKHPSIKVFGVQLNFYRTSLASISIFAVPPAYSLEMGHFTLAA